MAAHSSVLAWRIPGTGEPGGLPSMGSHSHNTSFCAHIPPECHAQAEGFTCVKHISQQPREMWSPDRDHKEIMKSGLGLRCADQSTLWAALMGTF